MAKVYVATMHTGNTFTIHGKSFYKGRPVVVEDEVLVKYLREHPNFHVEERIVAGDVNKRAVVQEVRADMKARGEEVAPAVFDGSAAKESAGGENTTSTAGTAAKAPIRRAGAATGTATTAVAK